MRPQEVNEDGHNADEGSVFYTTSDHDSDPSPSYQRTHRGCMDDAGVLGVNEVLFLFHGELHTLCLTLLLLLVKLPGQRVHLQLLPQADLLQAVVEVGLWAAASGGRQSEDTHDLPLVFSGVHEQAEADQDHQQVNISGLIPGFVHRIIYRLRLVP